MKMNSGVFFRNMLVTFLNIVILYYLVMDVFPFTFNFGYFFAVITIDAILWLGFLIAYQSFLLVAEIVKKIGRAFFLLPKFRQHKTTYYVHSFNMR